MMMRPSPKLVKGFSRSYACTVPFSSRLSRFLLTAAEVRFEVTYSSGERPEPFPVVLKDPIFQAVGKFRTGFTRTSVVLQKYSSVCRNPEKGSNLLSQGVHIISIDARKGELLLSGHIGQHRCVHSACEPSIGCTNKEFLVPKTSSSSESNGENNETQQSGETSSTNCEEVVCTHAIDGKESDMKVAFRRKIRKSTRFKNNPEVASVLSKLALCSKRANLHGALEVFDQVKEQQRMRFDINMYNTLLYICSGAASGKLLLYSSRKEKRTSKASPLDAIQHDDNVSQSLEGQEESDSFKVWVHFSPKDIELALTRGADILEDMLQQGVELNEASYTSIVRFAVAKNDNDLAFETIKLMESSGIPPKLRSYGPLLMSICESNKADKADEVDDHMVSLGLQPDESMLDSLLKVSTETGREDKIYSVLHRLRKSLRTLLPTTVQSIERWFTSEHAAFAGKARWKSLPTKEHLRGAMAACGGGCHGLGWLGMGAWQVTRTSISKTGSCLSCGERLCATDLDTKDTEDFANSVAALACRYQKSAFEFEVFQNWLDKNGPFDAIIDGANVGLYNPRLFTGFNVSLLQAVVNAASTRFCTRKPPLVLLHNRHRREITRFSDGNAILNMLRRDYAVYFTPMGSNDDWFWLYAAVKCKCFLLSNDEMRDHIFALLGNNFFPKWKERHQVRFTFTPKSLEIHMPPPYSTVLQESENGSWHIPQALQGGDDEREAAREWLCVTRPGAFPEV